MSDALRSGISVNIDFVESEIANPAKLTAITAQLRRGLAQVEAAIGDVHNESYPYTSASPTTLSQAWGKDIDTGEDLSGSEERDLDIVNLARLIGPASNLNPKTISGERQVREDVPVGVYEFSLRWPVSGDLADVTTTDPALVNYVSNTSALTLEGDNTWTVSRAGKVRCTTPTEGGTITYTMNPLEFGGGLNYSGASFNVIPDPNQIANGNGLAIGSLDGSGRRLVSLPVITHQQSNISEDSIELDDTDPNHNEQLKLPRVLNLNLTAGDEIPSGFLFLKNETTGEVYEDGIYYWNDANSIHVANVDLEEALNASNSFSLITVGVDITTSIDDLRNKTYHAHDRSHGEPFVKASGIIGQYEEAGLSGPFTASDIPGNYFSQYLHRDGYRGGQDQNINDSNAMRGNIVFGALGGLAGGYINLTGDSFGVYFGGPTDGDPHIRRDGNDLEIYSGNAGDTVITASNPESSSTVLEQRVTVNRGIIGDVVGSIGIAAVSNGLAPYVKYSAFNSLALGVAAEIIDLDAEIYEKEWYSVTMAVRVPGSKRWITPTTSNTFSSHSNDEWGFIWEEDSGTHSLWVWIGSSFNSGIGALASSDPLEAQPSFSPGDTLEYKVVIWYQP